MLHCQIHHRHNLKRSNLSTLETEDRLDRGCCLRPCAGCMSAKDVQTWWDSCYRTSVPRVPSHSPRASKSRQERCVGIACCVLSLRADLRKVKPRLHAFSRSACLRCQGNRSLVHRLNWLNWWARHLHVNLRWLLQLLQGVFPAQNSIMDQPSSQHDEQPHRE